MGTQLIGLFCLILTLAAVFYLWSQALNDRSKHVESAPPPAEPVKETDSPQRVRGYSLAPAMPIGDVESPEQAVEVQAGKISEPKLVPYGESAACQLEAAENELAKTHLEIAHQFFQMGDFEGASDMTRLVHDNPDASAQQKEAAQQLLQECT